MEKEKLHMDIFGRKNVKNYCEFINESKMDDNRIKKLKNSLFIKDILSNGWKPYIVGGFVRDYIMKKESKDIDLIIVGCDKEELISLLSKYGDLNLVGESFSVIKFNYNNEEYDISIPRIERKIGKGYQGFEVISNKNISLEEDLFRRDITINSIAMDLDGNYIDPYNGKQDINNKIIRITNPKAFTEDPLRVLRCFRFSARYNFEIDRDTSIKIKEIKNNIGELSQERIIEEFYKMYDYAKNADSLSMFIYYLNLLDDYDMFEQMFPGIKVSKIKNKYEFNDLIILANLFEDNDNLESKMMKVKFPSKVAKAVSYLVKFKNEFNNVENVYNLMKDKKRHNIPDDLLIFYLKGEKKLNKRDVEKFLTYCNSERVSGNDLMAQGFKGPEIGKEQRRRELKKFNDM